MYEEFYLNQKYHFCIPGNNGKYPPFHAPLFDLGSTCPTKTPFGIGSNGTI
jgi:hypothetical protein